jgi:hypothetical protein
VDDAARSAAGVLILRLWVEVDDRLRVRITASTDLASAEPVTSYAASPAEVLARVQEWLDAFVTPR